MATRTSIGTGLWSAVGTWDTGVPLDNDVVVIAAGHVVTFDVDQSGFANGIDGITITGTLKLTRTAGTYYLKVKAAKTIGGAGTFDCGTLADPIPFATKHTITGGAAWYIKGNDGAGLTMTVYAAEPTIKTIYTTGIEAIGQTVLEVGTDVTGDIWADGDTISISEVNTDLECEERVIAAGGRAAGSITITAGLTAAKGTGSYINLITRNVRFIGNGGNMLRTPLDNKLTIAGGEWLSPSNAIVADPLGFVMSAGIFHQCTYGIYKPTGGNIIGGVFSGCYYASQGGQRLTISGGMWAGNTNCVNGGTGYNITGGHFAAASVLMKEAVGMTVFGGTFCNSYYGFYAIVGLTMSGGTIEKMQIGIQNSSANIKNVVFNTITNTCLNTCIFTAFNCLFNPTGEVGNYSAFNTSVYSESIDHDQTTNKFAAWTRGGLTVSQAVVLPTGYTLSNQTTLADASNEGYWQKEVTVGAGASVSMDIWLRKDASMTYLPNCIIFNKASTDPFAGGTGVHTFTMTNSIDTWEQETYVYTNTTANSVSLIVRFQGKNATGNFFSAITLDVLNVDLTTLITSTNALTATVANIANDVWSASSTTDYGDSTMGKHVSKKLLKQANFIALK